VASRRRIVTDQRDEMRALTVPAVLGGLEQLERPSAVGSSATGALGRNLDGDEGQLDWVGIVLLFVAIPSSILKGNGLRSSAQPPHSPTPTPASRRRRLQLAPTCRHKYVDGT
jgi:hypothetical protein